MVNLSRKDEDNGLRAVVLSYLSLIKKDCTGVQNRADFLLDRFREQAAEGLQNGGSTLRFSCGSDERWRSFRGEHLIGFEALLARMMPERN